MLARERRQVATQRQAESLKAAHLGCEVLGAPRVAPHHQERGAPAHVARHLLCVVQVRGAGGRGGGVGQGRGAGAEAVWWGRGSGVGEGQCARAGAARRGRGSVVGQRQCGGAGAVRRGRGSVRSCQCPPGPIPLQHHHFSATTVARAASCRYTPPRRLVSELELHNAWLAKLTHTRHPGVSLREEKGMPTLPPWRFT